MDDRLDSVVFKMNISENTDLTKVSSKRDSEQIVSLLLPIAPGQGGLNIQDKPSAFKELTIKRSKYQKDIFYINMNMNCIYK